MAYESYMYIFTKTIFLADSMQNFHRTSGLLLWIVLSLQNGSIYSDFAGNEW